MENFGNSDREPNGDWRRGHPERGHERSGDPFRRPEQLTVRGGERAEEAAEAEGGAARRRSFPSVPAGARAADRRLQRRAPDPARTEAHVQRAEVHRVAARVLAAVPERNAKLADFPTGTFRFFLWQNVACLISDF